MRVHATSVQGNALVQPTFVEQMGLLGWGWTDACWSHCPLWRNPALMAAHGVQVQGRLEKVQVISEKAHAKAISERAQVVLKNVLHFRRRADDFGEVAGHFDKCRPCYKTHTSFWRK